METGHIREFVMLAECLNFSEAAERLFISQSSLSKHIRALERELGEALFVRTTRSIRLSEAGELYLPYARQITGLCDQVQVAMDDMRRHSAVSLTIAVMQNPQYYDLAKYMVGFRQAHPELTFNMVEADEQGLYDMFQKKQVNIFPAFANFPGVEGNQFMPMVESRVVALFRRDHPCAGEGSVSLARLGRERLLLPTRGGSLLERIYAAFRREGIEPHVVYEGSSIGCVDLVKAGMGVSLHGQEFAVHLRTDPEVVSVPIEPAITFLYGLCHRDPSQLSRAEQMFLSHMKRFELK